MCKILHIFKKTKLESAIDIPFYITVTLGVFTKISISIDYLVYSQLNFNKIGSDATAINFIISWIIQRG